MLAERVIALVIDVIDGYDEEMEDFLIQRGWELVEIKDSYGGRAAKQLKHPNAKAVHFGYNIRSVRIFFPNEGEAQIFSLVFGHKIHSSYIPSIQQFKEKHE